jgi:hypothetical protein
MTRSDHIEVDDRDVEDLLRRSLGEVMPRLTDHRADVPVGRDDVEWPRARQARRRLVVPALIAAGVICGGVVVVRSTVADRSEQGEVASPAPSIWDQPRFRYDTSTVSLSAYDIIVTAAGREFRPNDTTVVSSDSGFWLSYTTLELAWFEGDIEQRLNITFESDGRTWWVSDIQGYDGKEPADWSPAVPGRFFETPVGQRFEGGLELGGLSLRGLRLTAFPRPGECDPSATGVFTVVSQPVIDMPQTGAFGLNAWLVDRASCAAVPSLDGYQFDAELPISLASDSPVDPQSARIASPYKLDTGAGYEAMNYTLSPGAVAGVQVGRILVRDRSGVVVDEVSFEVRMSAVSTPSAVPASTNLETADTVLADTVPDASASDGPGTTQLPLSAAPTTSPS